MFRVRITYSKRGRGCFISHISMPQTLYRAGRRAGLDFVLTEGFSPRPRVSLGPELPVGIIALSEPADIWVRNWNDDFLESWNKTLPSAFTITGGAIYEGPSISKSCNASGYLIGFRSENSLPKLVRQLEDQAFLPEKLLNWTLCSPFVECVFSDPYSLGPGALIKELERVGLIQGWADVKLVRTTVGKWNEGNLEPLVFQKNPPRLPAQFIRGEGVVQ
ncbi:MULTISPECIES: TIGR03936 family radical SAM-associated protein [Aminobacterium]|nr:MULTISPECIES: TIGR03936 family radical SAM-associated protein [unclassified Aminobacterium]